MTDTMTNRRHSMRHLLIGSASVALATMLATPQARAQVAAVRSTSPAVVSDQLERGAVNIADASDTLVTIATSGPVTGSTAILADNALSATSRGNKAALSLALDAAAGSASLQPTHLATGAGGITADADAVIAASQRDQGTANGALLEGSRVALIAGTVSAGALAVERNSQETIALGNDASAGLALSGTSGGAGIATVQSANGAIETADDTSPVGARSYGQAALSAEAVSGSALSLSDNLERAIGYGNAIDNSLSVRTVGIGASGDGGPASVVAGGSGDAMVDAGYAVLGSQYLGAAVKARAGHSDTGPAFLVTVAGFAGSSLANDGNRIAAGSYGNQSANTLAIDAVSIAPVAAGGEGGGAVANVTGVQRLGEDGRVIATTYGGASTEIAGDITGSTVTASRNSVQALAVGNRADGNMLTVTADGIDSADDGPSPGSVGSALVGHEGTATSTGAFSVQNVQDSGNVAISAGQVAGRTGLTLGGAVSGSTVAAMGNDASAAATRNQAVNGVTIAATDLRTSADLNSFQFGGGNLVASLGSIANPGGATIAAAGPLTGSTLTVSGNGLTGTATGNSGANSMTVTGTTMADGSGHGDAGAGLFGGDNGAAATFALANQQQLGVPESGIVTPAISQVVGRFAATVEGGDQSSFAVDDNMQQSAALGSTAVNRLAITATGLGGASSAAPGSALFSVQFGSAAVAATSAMDVAAGGAGDRLSVSINGNANQASAAINQADNGLSVAAVNAGGEPSDAAPEQASLGLVYAAGDHVLANWQVATGSSGAIAATRLLAGGIDDLDGSDVSIAKNATSADATANRALNMASIAIASGDAPSAGLVSSQRSNADVSALATTNVALVGTGAQGPSGVNGSSVALNGNRTTSLARGNAADNQLALSGTGPLTPTPAVATAGPGASAQAGAALLNVQVNSGAISSSAAWTSYAIPLNAGGTGVGNSSLGVTGNAVSAAAYGNAANNIITVSSRGGMPGAALVNSQVNSGPVTAQVTGASYRVLSGPVTGAALSLTGNQLTASAIGSLATSGITATR